MSCHRTKIEMAALEEIKPLVSNVSSNIFMKFDRNKAVDYALNYADSPNSDYLNFGNNDCTNFVSQCWAYSGNPTSTDWFCLY